MLVAGSTLFSATVLLSTVFKEVWLPPLLVLCATAVMQFVRLVIASPTSASLLGVMTGETFFWNRHIPILGVLITAALSAVMLYGATLNLARRDF